MQTGSLAFAIAESEFHAESDTTSDHLTETRGYLSISLLAFLFINFLFIISCNRNLAY